MFAVGIGVTRFERATSPTPRVRATRLRHTPKLKKYGFTVNYNEGHLGCKVLASYKALHRLEIARIILTTWNWGDSMRWWNKGWIGIAAIIALLVVSACSSQNGSQADTKLTISAAASLSDALDELKTAYESAHPDVSIVLNYGSSGALQQQIEQGAPVDVFLSASVKHMDELVEQGLVAEHNRKDLLSGKLVVVKPRGSAIELNTLTDLLGSGIQKLAVGIPESVPAGDYAKEALIDAGLWDKLRTKTVQGKDVRQVLQYVETGNADAGIVYRTDALRSERVDIAFEVNQEMYATIRYPLGMIKATRYPDEALEWYRYLQSEAALDVFEKYGFMRLGD